MQWDSRPVPLITPKFNQRLGAAIKWDALITPQEKAKAETCYRAAARLFETRKGGSMQVYGSQPLPEDIWTYRV